MFDLRFSEAVGDDECLFVEFGRGSCDDWMNSEFGSSVGSYIDCAILCDCVSMAILRADVMASDFFDVSYFLVVLVEPNPFASHLVLESSFVIVMQGMEACSKMN